jgi:hypothetical protein
LPPQPQPVYGPPPSSPCGQPSPYQPSPCNQPP